jgi:hypothetical protein
MRRMRAKPVQPVSTRSGVINKVRHSKRSVQSPVERIKASAGLAPNWSANAAPTR